MVNHIRNTMVTLERSVISLHLDYKNFLFPLIYNFCYLNFKSHSQIEDSQEAPQP